MIGRVGSVGRLGLQGGRLLLYPQHVQEFLDRRTAADVTAGYTAGLERGVTDAFSICIEALVAAGHLGISGGILAQAASVIKAGVPMLGAGSLPGALVPWARDMPTPTNFNFVDLDYNRKTGLIGDGATKYLNTNRNNNADPQDNKHLSVYVTQQTTSGAGNFPVYIGFASQLGWSAIIRNQNNGNVDMTVNRQSPRASRTSSSGFIGVSRNSSTSLTSRIGNSNQVSAIASETPANATILVQSNLVSVNYSNGRLAYHSSGEALDLAIKDVIITTLVTSIAAAIP